MQTAYQLKDNDFQALLKCSFPVVRIQSKLLLAVLSKHLEISYVGDLSLQKDEVAYVSHCLSNLMQCNSSSWMPSDESVFSSIEEIIYSLQCLISLPVDKANCGHPLLIDKLIYLSFQKNMPYAKAAFGVLWDLFVDPKVQAIARRESINIQNLKQLFSLHYDTPSEMSYNAFTALLLGNGNAEGELCLPL